MSNYRLGIAFLCVLVTAPLHSNAQPTADPLAIKVNFALSTKAAAYLAKGNKLSVHVSFRGDPLPGRESKLEMEEDDRAFIANSQAVIVSSATPLLITPSPSTKARIKAQQGLVKELLVSAHGTSANVTNDVQQPLFACLDDVEIPISVARQRGVTLKCDL